MSPTTEIDAIASINSVFSKIPDPTTRDRVLKWAWDKFATKAPSSSGLNIQDVRGGRSRAKAKVKVGRKVKLSSKVASRPSIVKELNLCPKGKKTFKDFVKEKQPTTNQEKCTVAVYYLRQELDFTAVSISHVFTCYKDAGWRIPDLCNVMKITASRKGWVDTSNTESITITPGGENLVEYDLPKQNKGKA
jgi:hypothetical protein